MQINSRALALDLTRLAIRSLRSTPRGIDRVELLYARHFLNAWPGPCFTTLTTDLGTRLGDRRQALMALGAIESVWGEDADVTGRKVWTRLKASLVAMPILASLGEPVRRALPEGSLYLNVGHMGLSSRRGRQWLSTRPDVVAVFMLHDLIPLHQPEHISVRGARYFARIMDALARADGLILNSEAVNSTLSLRPGLTTGRTLVSHLPTPTPFLPPRRAASPRPRPYFIAYGQADKRKNFLLLAEAWRTMAQEDGSPPADLLIVSARGNQTADLRARLDEFDKGGRWVRLVDGMTTAQLRQAMEGASGMLSPSFAEGFGFPVVESLSLGIPALASDIPAHREVGRGHATYLDPGNPRVWADAVRDLIANPPVMEDARSRAASYAIRTPESYFTEIEEFLRTLRS